MFYVNLLTKIKNSSYNKLKTVEIQGFASKKLHNLLLILYKEGYISKFCYKLDKNDNFKIVIFLKYYKQNKKTLINIKQISKSNRSYYCSSKVIWKLKNNFGTYILSTPLGFLNDVEARQLNVGGKLICAIY